MHLADDGSGKNSIQTELQHPLQVALTFGKTFVKFVVRDTVRCRYRGRNKSCVLIVAVMTAQLIRISRNFRLSSPFADSVVPVARRH